MTPEEKAKAYDEALERARKLYNSEETSADVEIACETIFPELAESEDEKIRKEIISHLQHEYVVKRYVSDVEYDRWIAWLEKQGNVNALIQEASEKSYTEGMRVERKRWLEKQGKSMWTDEDEERLQSCIIELQGKGLMGGVDTIDTKWLKSLKQRMEE